MLLGRRQFVDGNDERPVEKECAIRVCRLVLTELVGAPGANSAAIDFDTAPVTVGDVLGKLEEMSDSASAWRCILRQAGFGE